MLLKELKEYCGGSREIRIARELTKNLKSILVKTLMTLSNIFDNNEPKGEFTILVKGILNKKNSSINNLLLREELHELVSLV